MPYLLRFYALAAVKQHMQTLASVYTTKVSASATVAGGFSKKE